ncbi:septal ring lytic transglycosylase RlpA family protein [Candidatus Magnetaquicoccus inordinatus]|uniref:septal ring lytic transglycosylase RlpA family protein n=1 Tax=Candidatus Magnetaquicoccus inordinatus TaxID=2496818 RepID=UPI00102BD8C4|nr:septal ring lytic transglycosylase RlpA family protein [Candidatus Magnetaquicoccus inordinatus]
MLQLSRQTFLSAMRLPLSLLTLLVLSLINGCAMHRDPSTALPIPQPSQPAPPGIAKVGTPYTVSGVTYYPKEIGEGFAAEGIASWYGPQFHGKNTANGEKFDMNSISAAHTTLPLPMHVRVTNLHNDRWLIVRINDRGPFVRKRLLDLSKAAAEELDFLDQGTTSVRIEDLSAVELSLDAHTIVPERQQKRRSAKE